MSTDCVESSQAHICSPPRFHDRVTIEDDLSALHKTVEWGWCISMFKAHIKSCLTGPIMHALASEGFCWRSKTLKALPGRLASFSSICLSSQSICCIKACGIWSILGVGAVWRVGHRIAISGRWEVTSDRSPNLTARNWDGILQRFSAGGKALTARLMCSFTDLADK